MRKAIHWREIAQPSTTDEAARHAASVSSLLWRRADVAAGVLFGTCFKSFAARSRFNIGERASAHVSPPCAGACGSHADRAVCDGLRTRSSALLRRSWQSGRGAAHCPTLKRAETYQAADYVEFMVPRFGSLDAQLGLLNGPAVPARMSKFVFDGVNQHMFACFNPSALHTPVPAKLNDPCPPGRR